MNRISSIKYQVLERFHADGMSSNHVVRKNKRGILLSDSGYFGNDRKCKEQENNVSYQSEIRHFDFG